ncbi:MAG: hypothetical protein ACYDEX_25415 [Mobilitalea sp.]
MLKTKLKKIMNKALFLLLFSFIYLGIGFIVAILISNKFNYNLQEVMIYEGLIIILIGILMSMKGNPSGISISGMGSNDATITSYMNNEFTRQEREINPYHKDYFNNNLVKFSYSNLTFIFGGIFIISFGVIFL